MERPSKEALLLAGPLVALVLGAMVVPLLGTCWSSLWQEVPFLARSFRGMANYADLLREDRFWQALAFTLAFCLCSVGLEMVAGVAAALILNERLPGRGLMRTAALLPWVIPSAVGARLWQLIWRYREGMANLAIGWLGMGPVSWLGTPLGAFACVVVADAWRTTPFVALIVLAGLQGVPPELHLQARVDGASPWQRLWRVTLPAIRPALLVALAFRSVDALRVFDPVYVITGGGPGGWTTSLSLYAYRYFLIGDFGHGSAASVLLFLMALGMALAWLGRLRVEGWP